MGRISIRFPPVYLLSSYCKSDEPSRFRRRKRAPYQCSRLSKRIGEVLSAANPNHVGAIKLLVLTGCRETEDAIQESLGLNPAEPELWNLALDVVDDKVKQFVEASRR